MERHIIQGLMRIDSLNDEELYELINYDLANNINFFDLADIYLGGEAERKVGRVILKDPSIREKMFIQTKCSIRRDSNNESYYDLSYEHIIESVNESLKRLNTSYIDCLLLHRIDIFFDPKEINKAFNELYKSKKVRHFGVSNFPKEAIEYLSSNLDLPLEYNQIQFGLGQSRLVNEIFNINMDNDEGSSHTGELFYYLKRKGISIQCWSPPLRRVVDK